MGRGNHADGLPTGFKRVGNQAVSKLRLPHYLLAAASSALTLLLSAYLGIGGTGPQGPAGTTRVVQQFPVAGVCAYFGQDSTGRLRFQVSTPKKDAAGPWCDKGKYVSVIPGR